MHPQFPLLVLLVSTHREMRSALIWYVMREVLLHDAKRVPANWTGLVSGGQHAAFLTDIESCAPVYADGTPVQRAAEHFCWLFDSLAQAETYCREEVTKIPRVKCQIFDSQGRANAPVAIVVNDRYLHKVDSEHRARRLIRWGVVVAGSALPLFIYALLAGAQVVWWPILVGTNLAFAGLRLMHWGQGVKDELKYRQNEAARRRVQAEKTSSMRDSFSP
jgi:hypothetical protein